MILSIANITVELSSLKDDLSSDDVHNIISYLNLRMKDPTDRATKSENNLNKYLKLGGFEIQDDVLTKEQIRAKWFYWTSSGFSILGRGLMIYKYIGEVASPGNAIRAAGLAATTASHAINRTNMLVDRSYGYGEALENKGEHYDEPAPAVDIDCIYTDIQLYKFIKKKTYMFKYNSC